MRSTAGTAAPRRPGRWRAMLLMPVLLAACGQTGPLALPEKPDGSAGAVPGADAASDPQSPDRAGEGTPGGEADESAPGDDDGN